MSDVIEMNDISGFAAEEHNEDAAFDEPESDPDVDSAVDSSLVAQSPHAGNQQRSTVDTHTLRHTLVPDTAVHNTLIDLTRAVSAMRVEQQALCANLALLQKSVDEMKDNLNAYVAVSTDSGTYQVEDHGTASHTRQVSSGVPAALIRGIWYEHNPGSALPVDFAYLKKICDATFPSFSGNTKRVVGTAMSRYIDQIDHSVGVSSSMLIILSRPNDLDMAEMRRMVLSNINTLGTSLAFMLPFSVSSLLNRVSVINNGKFVLRPQPNTKDMLKEHDGYDRLSDEHRGASNVIKGLKLLKASGYTKSACTKLYNAIATGGVQQDGKLVPSDVKEGRPVTDLGVREPRTDVSSPTKSQSTVRHEFNVDDIFSPIRD